jgi:small conductance mechanosensitive channel
MDLTSTDQLVGLIGSMVTTWGLQVIGAVAVLLIGRGVARWLRSAVRKTMERREADPTLVPFISGLVYWVVLLLVVVAVLGLFGIPTASFVAVLGAASLAVGLALQGTLSSFAGGVMLLVFRPFKAGDVVDVAGSLGTVQEVGIFSTILHTPDNVRIVIPNSSVFGQVIKNFTANDRRRIDLVVGVSYDDDLERAGKIIDRVIRSDDRVLDDPAPVVAVSEMADSSVNFVVRPWCRTEDYWDVRWDLTRRLKEELEADGCSIPYPQRDVHVFQVESGGA